MYIRRREESHINSLCLLFLLLAGAPTFFFFFFQKEIKTTRRLKTFVKVTHGSQVEAYQNTSVLLLSRLFKQRRKRRGENEHKNREYKGNAERVTSRICV